MRLILPGGGGIYARTYKDSYLELWAMYKGVMSIINLFFYDDLDFTIFIFIKHMWKALVYCFKNIPVNANKWGFKYTLDTWNMLYT